MASTIHWRLMFRVGNRAALDKCLARALPLFGSVCRLGECRPYWKIPELWECEIQTPVTSMVIAEQVLDCLLAAKRLAHSWIVGGPLSTENTDGFSGSFSLNQGGRAKIVGLEYASFDFLPDHSQGETGFMFDPQFEDIPQWNHETVEQAVFDNDVEALLQAVIAVSMHDANWRYAQDLCVRLSSHPHFNVRGNAVLGFGHIARVHRQLEQGTVQSIIEAALSDPDDYVRGHAVDAADDTSHFLGWRYHQIDVD